MPQKRKKQTPRTKKSQSSFYGLELDELEAKNEHQRQCLESFMSGNDLCMTGSAGTGKTYLALWLALDAIRREEAENVVIVRSAVQTRDVGALPGTLEEKEQPYLIPYFGLVNKMFGRGDAFQILQEKGVIEFTTTSFLRGITIDNAVVIIDEAQNDDSHELISILTRLGHGSRFILCGDSLQTDLITKDYGRSTRGYEWILSVLSQIDEVDQVQFEIEDIVRSGFVKQFLIKLQSTSATSK